MNITQEGNEQKKEVVSDKAAKAEGQRLISNELSTRQSSGEDNRGTVIEECPVLPLGNQIFLEYNMIETTDAGIKLPKPQPKYKFPKIIGYGANVKTFNIGDHICMKANSDGGQVYEVDKFCFHVIYETSVLGIYRGNEVEMKASLITKVKPTILV